LRTLPGEQHKSTGHFGHLEIGRARRTLMAFRHGAELLAPDFPALLLDAAWRTPARTRRRFRSMAGRAACPAYDNLKSAVWNDAAMRSASIRHCSALPDTIGMTPPVAVARRYEKGRVERAIRYVRDAFLAARRFTDLDDLNAQARLGAMGRQPIGAARRSRAQRPRGVREEAPRLLPLPTTRRRCSSASPSRSQDTLMFVLISTDYTVPIFLFGGC